MLTSSSHVHMWSRLPCYLTGKGPGWLVLDRVLAAFDLAQMPFPLIRTSHAFRRETLRHPWRSQVAAERA